MLTAAACLIETTFWFYVKCYKSVRKLSAPLNTHFPFYIIFSRRYENIYVALSISLYYMGVFSYYQPQKPQDGAKLTYTYLNIIQLIFILKPLPGPMCGLAVV